MLACSKVMKVLLAVMAQVETVDVMRARGAASRLHTIVDDPDQADLILLLGNDAHFPERLLQHTLYLSHPNRCAVYTEEDSYLPLVPGVYCSATMDPSEQIGRCFNYSYASRHGKHTNHYLASTSGAEALDAEKRLLFSFQGGSTSLVRKRLFNVNYGRPDILVENTANYRHWDNSQPDRDAQQLRYARTMLESHFVLCPRGAGAGSIRFFEVMAAGVAPVLIADDYALPPGVDWDSFLLRFPEREIARLPSLLEPHVASSRERGAAARRAYEQAFSPEVEFDRIVGLAALSLRHCAPAEAVFRSKQRSMVRKFAFRSRVRKQLRAVVKRVLKLPGIRSPYKLNS